MTEPINRKTVVVGYSVMPRHIHLIEHLMEDKSTYTSASDVVRRAIEFFHDKTYPAYVFNLTPAAKDKKKRQDDDAISDRDFAISISAIILTDKAGVEQVLMHQIGSMVMAKPLEGFKAWAEKHEEDMKTHAEKVKTVPVEVQMKVPYINGFLTNEYNLDLTAFV